MNSGLNQPTLDDKQLLFFISIEGKWLWVVEIIGMQSLYLDKILGEQMQGQHHKSLLS